MRKKLLKKTSYQRTKEEFETVRENRRKKKEVTAFSFDYCEILLMKKNVSFDLRSDFLLTYCLVLLHVFLFFAEPQEYLKNKQQREEAIQNYKQKKREAFQMLSRKTKKGQPNLNLQMEYLLHKIQGTGK